ncbi:MAG: hypothetical protein M3454_10755, partial [Actinomycetota bacterium]|nr:hypothetical protein [Actinomycetota bacterium]
VHNIARTTALTVVRIRCRREREAGERRRAELGRGRARAPPARGGVAAEEERGRRDGARPPLGVGRLRVRVANSLLPVRDVVSL